MNGERIQKVLARSGLGSRREIEDWIAAGRVTVNGKLATLGDRISKGQRLSIDGQPIRIEIDEQAATRVLILNKPEGVICTRHDPEKRPHVFQKLPPLKGARWISVGRLDINSMGLLLFTNNGELANRLMHPSHQIKRVYAVRVLGEVTADIKKRLLSGVKLEDGIAKFDALREQSQSHESANQWFHVELHEGRNREVRRLWNSQGLQVNRLIRIQYATISLPRNLRLGQWQMCGDKTVQNLMQAVGLASKPKQKASRQRTRHPRKR